LSSRALSLADKGPRCNLAHAKALKMSGRGGNLLDIKGF
jgi:hypothetical protein